MSLRQLPLIENFEGFDEDDDVDVPPDALSRWEPIAAARFVGQADAIVVDILDEIGAGFFGEGITAKRIREQLKTAGDVTVNINSPGGSFLEGNAIYTALVQHRGKVTVNVIGIAASIASVIAMAGDTIRIVENGGIMIHNARGETRGDRHTHEDTVGLLEGIDRALRGIYQRRTGRPEGTIEKMMDAETYFWGKEAVREKFADSILPDAQVRMEFVADRAGLTPALAKRKLEAAAAGQLKLTRNAVRKCVEVIRSAATPDAGADPLKVTPGAGLQSIADGLRSMVNQF